jgi:hypothetical protein
MNRRRTMVTPATAERKAPTEVGSGELLGRFMDFLQPKGVNDFCQSSILG